MSGVVPYLIRAYSDWIEDSGLTPHVLINCEKKGTLVPEGLAKDGKVVLNISSSATVERAITNDYISFKARFNGKSQQIIIPCDSVLTIYAQENGEGMFFDKPETLSQEAKKPNLTILD